MRTCQVALRERCDCSAAVTRRRRFLLVVQVCAVLGYAAAVPVLGSDDCAAPTVITGLGAFPFTYVTATPSFPGTGGCFPGGGGQPAQIGNDLWFLWINTNCDGMTAQVQVTSPPGATVAFYRGVFTCPPSQALCCLPTGAVDCEVECCDSVMIQIGNLPGGPGGGTLTIGCFDPPVSCDGEPEACCRCDGTCIDVPPDCCLNAGGTPMGPGTQCQGDNDNSGVDDACECVPPPPDMVAWWPLDELTGTTANDLALFNNVGTHLGSPTPLPGQYVDNSLNFDGINDFVRALNHPQLNLGTDDFTIDAWVRCPTGTLGVLPIVDKRSNSPSIRGYTLFVLNGRLGVQMADGSFANCNCTSNPATSACTNYIAAVGSPTVCNGAWNHVAVTVGRGSITGGNLWLNGQGILNFNPTIRSGNLNNNGRLWVGRRHVNPCGVTSFWLGEIDEVEIFKRELFQSEIEDIFQAGSAGKCKCVVRPPGMVSWWPGDVNVNAGDIVDGNPGTLCGGAAIVPGGLVGGAFEFTQVPNNADGISIPKSQGGGCNGGGGGNLDMMACDFTIDAWVNFSQTVPVGSQQRFMFANYAGVPAYGLSITAAANASVFFRPGNATTPPPSILVTATGTTPLNNGQWHHLAGVRSGNTALIYVDGCLEASVTDNNVPTVNGGSVDTSGCSFARIGATHTSIGHCTAQCPNPLELQFIGLIDEVEVFNRALSQSEIQDIFNARSAGKCK